MLVVMGIILRVNWGNSIFIVRFLGFVICGGFGDRCRFDGGFRNFVWGWNFYEFGSVVFIIGCFV